MKQGGRIARVSLDTRLPQLDRLFDYLIPEDMPVQAGCPVQVPLRSGARMANGYVVEVADTTEAQNLQQVAALVSPVEVLPPQLWTLAQAIARRQAGGVADVLRLAIPGRFVRAEKAWAERPHHREAISLPEEPKALPGYEQTALEAVCRREARSWLALAGSIHQGANTVAMLAKNVLARGESVVIVVPDWRDLRTYRGPLEEQIPDEYLSVWDGEATGSQRYRGYLRALEDDPVVILGNRHSVYAPVRNLGMIVVIDDQDESHQEPLAPYPHTRDVALLRHQQSSAALVFASRVPSMNVLRWIERGFVQALEPNGCERPRVIPTELSLSSGDAQTPARIPTPAYRGVAEALRSGPVLVQVFRAGFAPGLACVSCRARARCTRCSGPLATGASDQAPACGWCAKVHPRWRCPECGGGSLRPLGHGVGRTASELGKAFPGIPVIQADGRTAVYDIPPAPALVVATRGAEPVVDGGYRAALLLDGAAMLNRGSLVALEDTLRGWEHAISLVGAEGTVWATDVDGDPALALATGSYRPLLSAELAARESVRLPPAIRIAALTGPGEQVQALSDELKALGPEVDTLGPVSLGPGLSRTLVRFPYHLGEVAQDTLRAGLLRIVMKHRAGPGSRLRVVVDNTRFLDELTGEAPSDQASG